MPSQPALRCGAVARMLAVTLPIAGAAGPARAATTHLPGTSLVLTAPPVRTLEVTASDPATTPGPRQGSGRHPTRGYTSSRIRV